MSTPLSSARVLCCRRHRSVVAVVDPQNLRNAAVYVAMMGLVVGLASVVAVFGRRAVEVFWALPFRLLLLPCLRLLPLRLLSPFAA